jgi:hypothetical protein
MVIFDQSLQRITRFDTSGTVAGMWPGPPAMVGITPSAGGGWIVATVTDHPDGKPRRIEFVRYDALGNESARFPAPDAYHDGPWNGARAMTVILPDGRVVSGRTDSMSFVVSDSAGERRVAHHYQPVAYLPEERADLAAQYAANNRRRNMPGPSSTVPEFKTAYSYMLTDPDGRIMFRMRTPSYRVTDTTTLRPGEPRWRSPFELEVFDSTLAYRGRLITPRPVSRDGASFASDAAWLVHEGESGELYLVKWRAPRPVW